MMPFCVRLRDGSVGRECSNEPKRGPRWGDEAKVSLLLLAKSKQSGEQLWQHSIHKLVVANAGEGGFGGRTSGRYTLQQNTAGGWGGMRK